MTNGLRGPGRKDGGDRNQHGDTLGLEAGSARDVARVSRSHRRHDHPLGSIASP